MKRILIIEPYFGDSHRRLIEGMIKNLPAEFTMLTMPPRKWKWRMRGAAIYFAENLNKIGSQFDGVFCSAFLGLADLVAIGPKWLAEIPKVAYFHENQLTYPVRLEKEWDFHFGLTNITSALSADVVVFNSEFNRQSFLRAIPELIRKFPDYRPRGIVEKIEGKSKVLPPPLDRDEFVDLSVPDKRGPATFVWNHRWEFDKNPDTFFRILEKLHQQHHDFCLMVLGQTFKEYPGVFDRVQGSLKDRIVHWGYVKNRKAYIDLLSQCDVVVSTAHHEFFGISVMEAVAAGCYPVLPNRLAYPTLFPPQFLYGDESELEAKLVECIGNIYTVRNQSYKDIVEAYFWDYWIDKYNTLFD